MTLRSEGPRGPRRSEGSEASDVGTELELVWHDGRNHCAGLLIVLHGFAESPAAARQLGSLLDPGRAFKICEAVVLSGISQGAGLAAAATLGRSDTPAPCRLILFSGRSYPEDLVEWDFASASKTRVFAAHGKADTLSPVAPMRSFLDQAATHLIDVTWQTHPYGHTLDAHSLAAAATWLHEQG